MANYRPASYMREFVLLLVLLVAIIRLYDSPHEIFRSGRIAAIQGRYGIKTLQ